MAELWQTLIDNSGGVIAVFTVVLAFTTIIYVVVSAKLLKQSRNALLADITLRVMETYWETAKEMRNLERKKAIVFIRGWMEGYNQIFIKIDKRLGTEVGKLLTACLETISEEWKKEKEEEGKTKKENKKSKGPGTS
ncbi:unnamed protein product [marine sediment metagenome]|uniref:Uncharacterized protein n=1 Tax=marine sediment metagenome TaxID=412755 RepID=X1S0X3_9ZZZZ